jgi:hypothetical protein
MYNAGDDGAGSDFVPCVYQLSILSVFRNPAAGEADISSG